jgi:tetratricopeptide (TPR) repeat protein
MDRISETKGGIMFCINCGKELREEANFCANCGKPVQNSETSDFAENSKDQSQDKKTQEFLDRCDDLMDNEQYAEAVQLLTEAIRLDSTDAENYGLRGLAYHRMEKYADAVKDFSKAIKLNPSDGDNYGSRGIAYMNLGIRKDKREYFEKALEDLEEALQLGTSDNDDDLRELIEGLQDTLEEADEYADTKSGSNNDGDGYSIGKTLLELGGAFLGGFLTGMASDDDDDD